MFVNVFNFNDVLNVLFLLYLSKIFMCIVRIEYDSVCGIKNVYLFIGIKVIFIFYFLGIFWKGYGYIEKKSSYLDFGIK